MIEKTEHLTSVCVIRGPEEKSLAITVPREIVLALDLHREDVVEVSFSKVLRRPVVL